jgi:hypothetical protein
MKYALVGLSFAASLGAPLQSANAQAFGIEMGAPASELNGATLVDNSGPLKVYKLTKPPKPHSEFETYQILATDKEGICKVAAIGKDHSPDQAGYDVRAAYNGLRDSLKEKYGNGQEYDFIRSTALWDAYDEFAMSLVQGERTLAFFLTPDTANALPPGVRSIALEAEAVSSKSTYVTLGYEFENFDRCRAERTLNDEDGL